MDVLAQPLAQRREIARRDAVVERGDVRVGPLPQLAGDQVAERVGREVADQPGRPVHVLEHALGVVGHVEPEVLLQPGVPGLGQIGDLEPVLDQLLLELEAQHDVQPVGHLVGLDPDERALDPVHRAVEGVGVDAGAEVLPHQRREHAAEGAAAPDHVLPQAALRLVQAERLGPAERRALERVGDSGLVEPVAALVHGAVQRRGEVALVPAGRDADVAGAEAGGERMHGVVDPPALAVEAHPR